MIERSCVHPFIRQAQITFQNGSRLKDVLRSIEPYQQKVNRLVSSVSAEAKIPHAIGMSTIGLGAIVFYECIRAHGAPLPDSGSVVSFILPVASFSEGEGDGYFDTNTNVWRYGREHGYEGEELRKSVDEHRKAGHAQFDRYLEQGLMTPKEAADAKKGWDEKHGYRR